MIIARIFLQGTVGYALIKFSLNYYCPAVQGKVEEWTQPLGKYGYGLLRMNLMP